MNFMHGQGFAHRDIKCDNVMLTGPDRGTAKLGDFGLARTFFDSHSGSKVSVFTFCGTVSYMAPEILLTSLNNKEGYCPLKADVWAMGVMLFKLLNNQLPFKV